MLVFVDSTFNWSFGRRARRTHLDRGCCLLLLLLLLLLSLLTCVMLRAPRTPFAPRAISSPVFLFLFIFSTCTRVQVDPCLVLLLLLSLLTCVMPRAPRTPLAPRMSLAPLVA